MRCPHSIARFAPVTAAVLIAAAGFTLAGPLSPPSGSVASTYKTLNEVEPRIAINATNTPGDADSVFRITQPGSYYLTGNVVGVAGKHGIEIASSNVTIDLSGMTVDGAARAGVNGIHLAVNDAANTVVVNGSVRDWGGAGLMLVATGTQGGRVERVHSSGNGTHGFRLGNSLTVSHCSAYANGSDGFQAFSGVVITHCQSRVNSGDGFELTQGGTVSYCSAFGNVLDGFSVPMFDGNIFSHCVAVGNRSGFNLASVNSVLDSTASSNDIDGIRVSGQSIVRGNSVIRNGAADAAGAGIRAIGTDNRIEGNTSTSNDVGYVISGAGNLLQRNSATANSSTNWNVAVGNVLLIVAAPSSAAINGNAGGAGYGTTDPNANITY